MILFAVMTNNLLRDWHLRIKFVDDTTALEILPRNGISLLNVENKAPLYLRVGILSRNFRVTVAIQDVLRPRPH